MANVLTVVWLVIGTVAANTSLLVWASLMFPQPVERARQRLERRPYASFFIGLPFTLFSVIVAGAFLKEGNPGGVQMIGWLLLAPMLVCSIIGGAGFARILADRIAPRMRNESPILALTGGALCTTLPGLLPVIGWFVYYPTTLFMATGAGLMGLVSRRRVAEEPARQPRVQAVPGPVPGTATAGYRDAQPQFVLPGE